MTSETAISSKRNLLVAMAVIGHVASHKSSYGAVLCTVPLLHLETQAV